MARKPKAPRWSSGFCDWHYDLTWRLTGLDLHAPGRRSLLHGSSWPLATTGAVRRGQPGYACLTFEVFLP